MFYEGKVKISNQSYKKVDISDDLQLLNIIEKTKIFLKIFGNKITKLIPQSNFQ